jgi:hypothetical protein
VRLSRRMPDRLPLRRKATAEGPWEVQPMTHDLPNGMLQRQELSAQRGVFSDREEG